MFPLERLGHRLMGHLASPTDQQLGSSAGSGQDTGEDTEESLEIIVRHLGSLGIRELKTGDTEYDLAHRSRARLYGNSINTSHFCIESLVLNYFRLLYFFPRIIPVLRKTCCSTMLVAGSFVWRYFRNPIFFRISIIFRTTC